MLRRLLDFSILHHRHTRVLFIASRGERVKVTGAGFSGEGDAESALPAVARYRNQFGKLGLN